MCEALGSILSEEKEGTGGRRGGGRRRMRERRDREGWWKGERLKIAEKVLLPILGLGPIKQGLKDSAISAPQEIVF